MVPPTEAIEEMRKAEPELFEEIIRILNQQKIREEEISWILKQMRGRVSTKAYKQIERDMRRRRAEEIIKQNLPGPTYKENEIRQLQKKIYAYLKSPFFDIPDGERIVIELYGSLLTGYGTNPNKGSYQQPTDQGRVSDVDILCIISSPLFESLFPAAKGNPRATKNIKMTESIGTKTKFGPRYTGPFQHLFTDLERLSLAGRNNRPIHIVFIEEEYHKSSGFERFPHIKIIDFAT